MGSWHRRWHDKAGICCLLSVWVGWSGLLGRGLRCPWEAGKVSLYPWKAQSIDYLGQKQREEVAIWKGGCLVRESPSFSRLCHIPEYLCARPPAGVEGPRWTRNLPGGVHLLLGEERCGNKAVTGLWSVKEESDKVTGTVSVVGVWGGLGLQGEHLEGRSEEGVRFRWSEEHLHQQEEGAACCIWGAGWNAIGMTVKWEAVNWRGGGIRMWNLFALPPV